MTKTAAVFLGDGYEPTEATAPIDILTRGSVAVTCVSVMPTLEVKSAYGATLCADALVDGVEKVLLEEAGEQPLHREGYRGGTWVLLDYGCIAVHVFNAEAREFYGLERLWRDGKPVDVSGVVTPNE